MITLRFYKSIIVSAFFFLAASNTIAQSTSTIPVEKALNLAASQYQAYINQQPDSNWHLYSINKNNEVKSVTYKDWTSGFFPGAL
jgi:hypothetical protein